MSDVFQRLLNGEVLPNVYRSLLRADAERLAERATRAGWRCFVVRGQGVTSKAALLAEFARALEAPGWFGHNWDALLDILRDLRWASTKRGYVLIYDDVCSLASAAPEVFAVALDVLRDAVAFWRASSTPMTVLLRRLGPAARRVPLLPPAHYAARG